MCTVTGCSFFYYSLSLLVYFKLITFVFLLLLMITRWKISWSEWEKESESKERQEEYEVKIEWNNWYWSCCLRVWWIFMIDVLCPWHTFDTHTKEPTNNFCLLLESVLKNNNKPLNRWNMENNNKKAIP